MKMATKLTKAFAAFVGERGFEIVNEDEISQRPGEYMSHTVLGAERTTKNQTS